MVQEIRVYSKLSIDETMLLYRRCVNISQNYFFITLQTNINEY